MKRKFCLAVLIFQAALFGAFAANPASDFTFELNTDENGSDWVKITGIQNSGKKEFEIPAEIKGVPVREVNIVFKSQNPIRVTVPNGIKDCLIVGDTIVSQLPNSIETLALYKSYLEGSVNNLENLKFLYLNEVKLEDKKIIIKCMEDYMQLKGIFLRSIKSTIIQTNIEELVFEEGIETLDTEYCLYNKNSKLKKIVFPSTVKDFAVNIHKPGGHEIPFESDYNLSEILIPENVEHIKITDSLIGNIVDDEYVDWKKDIFGDTYDSLPLKTKAWLIGIFESKQAQRKFEFENNLD